MRSRISRCNTGRAAPGPQCREEASPATIRSGENSPSNVTNVTGDNHSQVVEIEAYAPGNLAAAANGAVATASTLYPGTSAGNAINGDHVGTGSWWTDNTSFGYPDWIEVQFAGS